jgi:hypothetical protein
MRTATAAWPVPSPIGFWPSPGHLRPDPAGAGGVLHGNRLLDAEPEGFTGGMTLLKAISLTKVSRATAWRDLAELVVQQAIEPIGGGRSRAYRLHWPGGPLPVDGA